MLTALLSKIETFNKDYVLFLENIDKVISVNDHSFFAALSDDFLKKSHKIFSIDRKKRRFFC
ncbi:TPA: hypothetical protein NV714_000132 [Escherichia coli]|nr:hypothetical protein [Escherichia coli]